MDAGKNGLIGMTYQDPEGNVRKLCDHGSACVQSYFESLEPKPPTPRRVFLLAMAGSGRCLPDFFEARHISSAASGRRIDGYERLR